MIDALTTAEQVQQIFDPHKSFSHLEGNQMVFCLAPGEKFPYYIDLRIQVEQKYLEFIAIAILQLDKDSRPMILNRMNEWKLKYPGFLLPFLSDYGEVYIRKMVLFDAPVSEEFLVEGHIKPIIEDIRFFYHDFFTPEVQSAILKQQ